MQANIWKYSIPILAYVQHYFQAHITIHQKELFRRQQWCTGQQIGGSDPVPVIKVPVLIRFLKCQFRFRFRHNASGGMQKANKTFSPKIMDFEYKRCYPNTFQRFLTKIRVNPMISIFRVNPLIPIFIFRHRGSIWSSFRPARKFGRFEGQQSFLVPLLQDLQLIE